LNNDCIFISDLHISLDKPEITQRFLRFLNQQAGKVQTIYILGDLFDRWVGDDDNTHPNQQIKAGLSQVTQSGTQVFFQPGNRDFLIGQRFCNETGVKLLDDYEVITLNGVHTLLTHGDLLCTDDVVYQAFRGRSRTVQWQQNVLSKPLWLRLLVARWYRLRSYWHKRQQSTDIMDVNQLTVIEVMQQYQCRRLIHGHTHRPMIHSFTINGGTTQRFVLSDWKQDGATMLYWNPKGYQVIDV